MHIVMEGDSKVNVIKALGELADVTHRISSTIIHLKVFITDEIVRSTQKRTLLNQVELLSKASIFLTDRVDYITSQSRVTSVTSRAQSRKRVADNMQNKIENLLLRSRKKIDATLST